MDIASASEITSNQAITFQLVLIVFAVCTVVVTSIIWMLSRFQSKEAALEHRALMDERITKVEEEVRDMQGDLKKIGSDVSYIRGRLEPKD